MLTSLRKISTLRRVEPVPVATAVAWKLMVEAVCRPLPGIGVAVTVTVGGEPTTLATLTVSGAVVTTWAFRSVTRAVRTRSPSWAAVGIHEKV